MHLHQFEMRKNGEDNNINMMEASTDLVKGIASSEDKLGSNFAKKSWTSSTSTSSSRVHNKVIIYFATLAVLILALSSFPNM